MYAFIFGRSRFLLIETEIHTVFTNLPRHLAKTNILNAYHVFVSSYIATSKKQETKQTAKRINNCHKYHGLITNHLRQNDPVRRWRLLRPSVPFSSYKILDNLYWNKGHPCRRRC